LPKRARDVLPCGISPPPSVYETARKLVMMHKDLVVSHFLSNNGKMPPFDTKCPNISMPRPA